MKEYSKPEITHEEELKFETQNSIICDDPSDPPTIKFFR